MKDNENIDIEKIANNAKEYAQKFVKKGDTHMEYNNCDADQRCALDQGIKDIRGLVKENTTTRLINNEDLFHFIRKVEISKKYGLGNCEEMALLALEYMIQNHPEIDAGVFNIYNGDHVFIVINHGHKPLRADWGDNAYICDPWANDVFPATEYLTKLKNFYTDTDKNGKSINATEGFNSRYHAIVPLSSKYTNQYILSFNNTEKLAELDKTYKGKLQKLHKSLVTINNQLEATFNSFSKKKNNLNNALENKAKELKNGIDTIHNLLEEDTSNEKNYLRKYEDLKQKLEDAIKIYNKSILFEKENPESKNRIANFFKSPNKRTKENVAALTRNINETYKTTFQELRA